MCTFLFQMLHCGIWKRCILGFVGLVDMNVIFNRYFNEFYRWGKQWDKRNWLRILQSRFFHTANCNRFYNYMQLNNCKCRNESYIQLINDTLYLTFTGKPWALLLYYGENELWCDYNWLYSVMHMVMISKRAAHEYPDDIMSWKQFLHYWCFVMGSQQSTVVSPHKGPVMWGLDFCCC